MQLDSTFIRNLKIPFDSVLPKGAKKEMTQQFKLSVHSPTKILAGEWSNKDVPPEAIRRIIAQNILTKAFLAQFPRELINQLTMELAKPETA